MGCVWHVTLKGYCVQGAPLKKPGGNFRDAEAVPAELKRAAPRIAFCPLCVLEQLQSSEGSSHLAYPRREFRVGGLSGAALFSPPGLENDLCVCATGA